MVAETKKRWRCAAGAFGLACFLAAEVVVVAGPLAPAEAVREFEVEAGFSVELVASEPLTESPVAIAFDEGGRLYVAECRDYPVGSADGQPLGRIALLKDTDGDGRMDQRVDFATGLRFPNGVMPWRGGVFVTAAPDVFYLKDTDGDDRADVREVVLTGFDTNASSQLRANDPTLGPDGWVYIAGGLRGGKVSSPKRPGVVLDTEKGDLRFRPDFGEMELVAGKSQFGLAFDDAGNRFACMNRVQSQHAPMPWRALQRNPLLLSPGTLQDCPQIAPNSLMTRYSAGAARYFPISDNFTTADSHAGTYSAACAVHIDRGNALPEDYRGAAFSCDPTGNLVRADRLEKVGGTFAARRIREGTEALRSRDNWFRPVFLADGPDGTLYTVDMYRKTIEHPEYLPEEVRKHTDFESGKRMGRIWRLGRSKSDAPLRAFEGLRGVPPEKLVRELNATIPWRRDTAFRLLMEGGDAAIGPALKESFGKANAAGSAVLHLRLLQILGALDDDILLGALRHEFAEVRQNAVHLLGNRMSAQSKWRKRIEAMAQDDDAHVRFQTALTLGELGGGGSVPALAQIASKQAFDRWTRAAILSGLGDHASALAMLKVLGESRGKAEEGCVSLAAELGRQLGLASGGEPAGYEAFRAQLIRADPALSLAATAGFGHALGKSFRRAISENEVEFREIFAAAQKIISGSGPATELKVRAIELLVFDDSMEAAALLTRLVEATQEREVQSAAAQALVQPSRAGSLRSLLSAERWNGYTPAVRTILVTRLCAQPDVAGLLLDALESGAIPMNALTPAQRERLAKDATHGARVKKLFARPEGNRDEAFERSKAALKMVPVPANGRAVFEKACESCHRFNQQGVAVGPDLFDIRNQSKEAILYHIILPEAEIAPNFVNYECELADGRTLSGLLASESSSQITLRMAQGIEEVVLRSQIVRLNASRLSLMPQELESAITTQELADLLAYLKGEQ